MYKSEISNTKWMICAIFADIGWILFLAALFLCFIKMPEIFENKLVVMLLMLDLLSAALMLCGIWELISEHLQKQDRVLTGKRLSRGFGALTFGGFFGLLCSLPAFVIALLNDLGGACYLLVLCFGGLLCSLYSSLILKEYRKI